MFHVKHAIHFSAYLCTACLFTFLNIYSPGYLCTFLHIYATEYLCTFLHNYSA